MLPGRTPKGALVKAIFSNHQRLIVVLNSFSLIGVFIKNSPLIYEIFIIVNNHFQGNAPETANELKIKFGLQYRVFNSQKSLIDYIQ